MFKNKLFQKFFQQLVVDFKTSNWKNWANIPLLIYYPKKTLPYIFLQKSNQIKLCSQEHIISKVFQQLVVYFEIDDWQIELPYHCSFIIPKKIIPYQYFYKKSSKLCFSIGIWNITT